MLRKVVQRVVRGVLVVVLVCVRRGRVHVRHWLVVVLSWHCHRLQHACWQLRQLGMHVHVGLWGLRRMGMGVGVRGVRWQGWLCMLPAHARMRLHGAVLHGHGRLPMHGMHGRVRGWGRRAFRGGQRGRGQWGCGGGPWGREGGQGGFPFIHVHVHVHVLQVLPI